MLPDDQEQAFLTAPSPPLLITALSKISQISTITRTVVCNGNPRSYLRTGKGRGPLIVQKFNRSPILTG